LNDTPVAGIEDIEIETTVDYQIFRIDKTPDPAAITAIITDSPVFRVEFQDTMIIAIADIKIALCVDGQTRWAFEIISQYPPGDFFLEGNPDRDFDRTNRLFRGKIRMPSGTGEKDTGNENNNHRPHR